MQRLVGGDFPSKPCRVCVLHGTSLVAPTGQKPLVHSVVYFFGDTGKKHGGTEALVASAGGSPVGITSLHQHGKGGLDFSHLHNVHICNSYGAHQGCRCKIARPSGASVKREYIHGASNQRTKEVLLYLEKGERRIIQENPLDGARPDDHEMSNFIKEWRESSGCVRHRDSSSSGLEGGEVLFEPFGTGAANDAPQPKPSGDRARERVDKVQLGEQASQKILEWQPVDMGKFREHADFKKFFPALYWDDTLWNSLGTRAWEDATQKWNSLSVREIIEERRFSPEEELAWYSPSHSAKILMRLLLEQFGNADLVLEWVQKVQAVLDRAVPKVNTICLVSAPSSGKTFAMKPLLDLLWNVGKIRNTQKGGDSFTYQDALNKRANEWNECCLVGNEVIDTAKMVWEGHKTPVNVKYKSNTILGKTPLIVTSNNRPWAHAPQSGKAFLDRCVYATWQSQPWLKGCNYGLHPMAWQSVFSLIEDSSPLHNLPATGELVDLPWPEFPEYQFNVETLDEEEMTDFVKSYYDKLSF